MLPQHLETQVSAGGRYPDSQRERWQEEAGGQMNQKSPKGREGQRKIAAVQRARREGGAPGWAPGSVPLRLYEKGVMH